MEATAKSFVPSIPNSEKVCSVCGVKTIRTVEFMGIKRTFRVMCKCMQKQQEDEKTHQEKQDRMKKAQKQGLIQALTELLKGAENTASYTKKQSKTDMEFIFLGIKELAKHT